MENQDKARRDMEGVLFTGHLEKRISNKTGVPYFSCGGRALIDGVEYFVAAFKKVDVGGSEYFNLSFRKAEDFQPNP